MNAIFISDGLGNQLFRYAFGYAVYRETGIEFELDVYMPGKLRKYAMSDFNLDFEKRFIPANIDYFMRGRLGIWARTFMRKIKSLPLVKEKDALQYDASVIRNEECYYDGFWQSYKYFDKYYDDIKRQMTYQKPLSAEWIQLANSMQETPSVCMHVRRTDYVREVGNAAIVTDYYNEALKRLKEEIGDYRLFIFSDDKDYVRNTFGTYDYTLVEGFSDIEEFLLMQKCRHHVIANSSFSWWAAYLSENKGGIVYAPITGIWKRDFYLPEWNCIETRS